MKEIDKAFQERIKWSFGLSFFASVILVLLMLNYLRISRYVILFNKMKEIDQLKDDFISLVSHELKTPLTAIRGYVDILKEEGRNNLNQQQKEYLENIDISANRLKNLVDDILEVSRIEQGRIEFKLEKINPVEVIEKVISLLSPTAKEKNLVLKLNNLNESGTKIKADRERLEQVLINLIGNAIKYTFQGEIEVKLEEREDNVLIIIRDTGVGMSAEAQKKLFEKFYRIKTQATSKIAGTGLGLWITKILTEKMNGKIAVESIEGVGSKFILSFKKEK